MELFIFISMDGGVQPCTLFFLSQEDARQEYVNIVEELVRAEGGDPSATEATEASPSTQDDSSFNTIIYEVIGKAAKITLNRPKTKNSITREVSILKYPLNTV